MRFLLAGFAGAVAMHGAAAAVIIDFEDQAAGAVITNQYGPLLTVSANSNGSFDQAMVFDTANPTGGDTDLAAPFNDPTTAGDDAFEPGNVLIISEDGDAGDPDDEATGGSILFDFDQVVEFVDIDIFDIDDGENISLEFRRSGMLNSTISIFDLGDGNYTTLTTLVAGTVASLIGDAVFIDRLVVTFSGSGAIDNLQFEVVPIPGALPLLLSGIAGLGFASRRRRKT